MGKITQIRTGVQIMGGGEKQGERERKREKSGQRGTDPLNMSGFGFETTGISCAL